MTNQQYAISAIRWLLHPIHDEIGQWSLSGTGEGTYMKFNSNPPRWGYVKIKFQHFEWSISESNRPPWSVMFSPSLDTFPEGFQTEISDTLAVLEPVIRVLTGKDGAIQIDLLDAEYHAVDTHQGSFAVAVVNALRNAIRPDLHTPDLSTVEQYRSDKRTGVGS